MKEKLLAWIDGKEQILSAAALDIWNHPELPEQEVYASGILRRLLKEEGFRLREIPDCPTSFVAEYGTGHPVIGILGEYDALPGLSQKVSTKKEPAAKEGDPGHACGHNLLGTAGVGAALALRAVMEEAALPGTLRFYGCAAEETLVGKPKMARAHVFDDLDAAITWHPSFVNTVWGTTFMANNSMRFHFKGISSHAAAAPEAGRSALDAVELMDIGANYLREHVKSNVRIHYAITNGGEMPNTVPADAEVWYNVRAPRRSELRPVVNRVLKVARGAAMMTETEVSWRLVSGCYEVLANHVIGDLMQENMELLGGPQFTQQEYRFAEGLAGQLSQAEKDGVIENFMAPDGCRDQILSDNVLKNIDYGYAMAGSTDVGDVSHIAPLATMTAACWPVGISSHTWMSCACTGSGIGFKAMIFAAKTLALTGYDLLTRPEKLSAAKEEFMMSTKGERYQSPFDEVYESERD